MEIIGNLDHAYQDFFSHAQLRTSRHAGTKAGEKNTPADMNSKWDGFKVWTNGSNATPEKRTDVLPSSYTYWHDEAGHPGDREPVVANSAEYNKRREHAIAFQKDIYSRAGQPWSVQAWWDKCACWVSQSH